MEIDFNKIYEKALAEARAKANGGFSEIEYKYKMGQDNIDSDCGSINSVYDTVGMGSTTRADCKVRPEDFNMESLGG